MSIVIGKSKLEEKYKVFPRPQLLRVIVFIFILPISQAYAGSGSQSPFLPGILSLLQAHTIEAISCNELTNSSLSGMGATDDFDSWQCFSSSSHQGPEMIYEFRPDGTGLVEVNLSGLIADLDLMVMQAVDGRFVGTDPRACLTGATSTRAGTLDEQVKFSATAGTTYYIVVDGFDGAISSFTLNIGTARNHIQLNEMYGGDPDYVEIINRSACDTNLSDYHLRYEPDCDPVFDFSFTNLHSIEAGGVFRLVENTTTQSNEVGTGSGICDNPSSDSWAALCYGGICDTDSGQTCARVIDFVERQATGTSTAPTCATFNPAPIYTTGRGTQESDTRTNFTGVPTAWQQSDWSVAPFSRD